MTQDIKIAYRMRELGLESAPVIDGNIDPKSWTLVDLDSLPEDAPDYIRRMRADLGPTRGK